MGHNSDSLMAINMAGKGGPMVFEPTLKEPMIPHWAPYSASRSKQETAKVQYLDLSDATWHRRAHAFI